MGALDARILIESQIDGPTVCCEEVPVFATRRSIIKDQGTEFACTCAGVFGVAIPVGERQRTKTRARTSRLSCAASAQAYH
ncbi:hypothetical protein EVAR_21902_1 [Eumeta japonica]|uniref:Uncharacterized protein n=1 Tax=Eumeta variegata TaxID=151549 RepID=A0A4C1XHG1_EUMVA|nr:hypothetical protein EVAR_21902_1 [Eumeta japonica]